MRFRDGYNGSSFMELLESEYPHLSPKGDRLFAAVVVLDACVRRRVGTGQERALEGTLEVGRAIIASAVTTGSPSGSAVAL